MKNFEEFNRMVTSAEKKQIAIDFDGVIHDSKLGFHDGTIYGNLVPGAPEALKKISKSYDIVIYTCKARTDRPLINNKTGIELIWEWLEKNNLESYVKEIASEKPLATFYIDDKAIEFTEWDKTLRRLFT
tara:strand:- start:181 stop:570 length:390 start_codon:yes stop_codon:yes gene_type:complete